MRVHQIIRMKTDALCGHFTQKNSFVDDPSKKIASLLSGFRVLLRICGFSTDTGRFSCVFNSSGDLPLCASIAASKSSATELSLNFSAKVARPSLASPALLKQAK